MIAIAHRQLREFPQDDLERLPLCRRAGSSAGPFPRAELADFWISVSRSLIGVPFRRVTTSLANSPPWPRPLSGTTSWKSWGRPALSSRTIPQGRQPPLDESRAVLTRDRRRDQLHTGVAANCPPAAAAVTPGNHGRFCASSFNMAKS